MSMFLKAAEINVGDWFMVDSWTNGDRSYIGCVGQVTVRDGRHVVCQLYNNGKAYYITTTTLDMAIVNLSSASAEYIKAQTGDAYAAAQDWPRWYTSSSKGFVWRMDSETIGTAFDIKYDGHPEEAKVMAGMAGMIRIPAAEGEAVVAAAVEKGKWAVGSRWTECGPDCLWEWSDGRRSRARCKNIEDGEWQPIGVTLKECMDRDWGKHIEIPPARARAIMDGWAKEREAKSWPKFLLKGKWIGEYTDQTHMINHNKGSGTSGYVFDGHNWGRPSRVKYRELTEAEARDMLDGWAKERDAKSVRCFEMECAEGLVLVKFRDDKAIERKKSGEDQPLHYCGSLNTYECSRKCTEFPPAEWDERVAKLTAPKYRPWSKKEVPVGEAVRVSFPSGEVVAGVVGLHKPAENDMTFVTVTGCRPLSFTELMKWGKTIDGQKCGVKL